MVRFQKAKIEDPDGGKCLSRSININHRNVDVRIGIFRWPWVYMEACYKTIWGQVVDSGLRGIIDWLFFVRRAEKNGKRLYQIRVLCFAVGVQTQST